MSGKYDLGDAVPLTYTISAVATVTLTVTDPDGVTSNPSLTQGGSPPAVTYTTSVSANKPGTWLYKFAATGAVTDSEDGQFFVRQAAAQNVYTTLVELKSWLKPGGISDTIDDDELTRAIVAASRAIDKTCQRHFYKLTETRTLIPDTPWCVELGGYNDLVSVTTLKTDATGDGIFEQTWAASDYQLLTLDGTPNVNAAPEPQPYVQVRAIGSLLFPIPSTLAAARTDLVQINGVWGWPAVPTAIRQACLMIAAETWKLKDAPLGVAGFGDLGLIRIRDNPKVARLLAPYGPLAAVA